MGNTRSFIGTRNSDGKKSIAAAIMRLEFEKKGRLDPTERFKLIMKMKMEAARQKNSAEKIGSRPMSAKAEKALKDVARKKEVKQAKKLRQMVIVQPQIYSNGRLNKKGQVYDIAGNMVATVNKKNGKMATMLGGGLGRYKPKSREVTNTLMKAIDQYSPYYINLRKLQALQAAGINPLTGRPINEDTINVHGNGNNAGMAMHGGGYVAPSERNNQPVNFDTMYGETSGGPRQNIGGTAWGAMSDNVWGTFTDNVWGTSADTVWGTNMSDVWGGVGGNPYGAFAKTVQVWGTGTGKNYIKIATNMIRKLFGMKSSSTVKAVNAFRQSRSGGQAPRSGTVRAAVSTPTRK